MKLNNNDLAQNKLKKYNQEHILKQIEDMGKIQREQILNKISVIDFDELDKLYKSTKNISPVQDIKITPIDYIDKAKISKEDKEKYCDIGKKIIQNDEYAVVTMAGGQGTRLGFNKPKGAFKLDIGENGKYIFELLTETLLKSKSLYGVCPYWYIMTSNQNNSQTVEFFEEHNYFGYDRQKVRFFKQGELPLLTEDGKLVIENDDIKMGANGNGGVYQSLVKEKMIDDMKSKNIKWVYICGVDNIMVKPIDPLFIGLTINKNMPVGAKSIDKAYPEEKIGVFCRKDGKPGVVEYTELSEEMRYKCDSDGELIYKEGTFVSFLFRLDSIEKVAKQNLEYHLAKKNGLYKFETFTFDAFKYFDDMLIMRVERDEEFAPIKNKEGVDSPQSAKEIYERNLLKNGAN